MAQSAIDMIGWKGRRTLGSPLSGYCHKHHALLTPLINVTEVSFTIPGYWERDYRGVGDVAFPNFGKPLEDGDVIAIREATMDK